MSEDAQAAAVKLRTWQERQKDFIKQTGLKRQYERENVVDFNKNQAFEAKKGADEYYKYWSKSIGANEEIGCGQMAFNVI